MDPLSISASVLTVTAAALATLKGLNQTVSRYKGRDKTLGRLQGGIDDLIDILDSLEEAADDETPILALLKGPVNRCAVVCREFDGAMKTFSAKSKTSLKDWTKMEFMRGNINEFIDTLADYKSTISIGLGTVTMHAARLTQQVVGQYNEMIKDTMYNLEIRLQRIDEKIAGLVVDRSIPLEESNVDLHDEKAVTNECLRICERAKSFIQSLREEHPTLQSAPPQQGAEYILQQFEAQLLTQTTLDQARDKFLMTIGRLQERLDSTTLTSGLNRETETSRFQEEINNAKQCLDVCREASSQMSSQKIHIIGDVTADEDCDQVVVTTLADLFNVGKVKAKSRTLQLVGSMPADALRDILKSRYDSRLGALKSTLEVAQLETSAESPIIFNTLGNDSSAAALPRAKEEESLAHSKATLDKPSSNEVRKRRAESENAKK